MISSRDSYSRGLTVWFTGFSGAGKSTIATIVHRQLMDFGLRTELLDADEIRQRLNRDLGFSKEDRDENVRRIAFVAELLTRHGVVVLVASIAPYRAARDEARTAIRDFVEVHVDAPISICSQRDPKGLYKKVHEGRLSNFTGIDAPYEEPEFPEVRCETNKESQRESADKVWAAILPRLRERNLPDQMGRLQYVEAKETSML